MPCVASVASGAGDPEVVFMLFFYFLFIVFTEKILNCLFAWSMKLDGKIIVNKHYIYTYIHIFPA